MIFTCLWCVIPFKDNKGIKINNTFQKTLNDSNCKPNTKWFDKGTELYQWLIKSRLQDNDIEMYSTHNEEKFVIAESVIIDRLADIVNEYNNRYHKTIKTKSVDVNSSTYIDFGVENNKKDPKFEVGDHVRISKCKNFFEKNYASNWSDEVFVIKKI